MLGNYVQTMEAAHPFRVEAESVACAFVEYSDPSDSSGIKIRKMCSELSALITKDNNYFSYNEALESFSKKPEYLEAKNSMLNDFFWDIGKYSVDVLIEYDGHKTKTFSYEFVVSEREYMELRNNIDESLNMKLKEQYGGRWSFNSPVVEVREARKKL